MKYLEEHFHNNALLQLIPLALEHSVSIHRKFMACMCSQFQNGKRDVQMQWKSTVISRHFPPSLTATSGHAIKFPLAD